MNPRLAAGFLAVVVAAGCADTERSTGVRVVEVIDGDTVDVRLDDGTVERIRLLGINAPERGECFDDDATAALADLVDGHEVALVVDQSDRDQYGRLLRYLEIAGDDIDERLVRQGAAIVRVSEPDTAREPALRVAQDEAREAGRGLWAPDACGAADPAASDLRVSALRLDADGDDATNLNDEWLEIDNLGAAPVDLTGWGVRDESASHSFAFPDGFALAPDGRVRIHSGCGVPTPTELFWCESGSAIWNNDGDTAFLLDPSGNVVDSRTERGG